MQWKLKRCRVRYKMFLEQKQRRSTTQGALEIYHSYLEVRPLPYMSVTERKIHMANAMIYYDDVRGSN